VGRSGAFQQQTARAPLSLRNACSMVHPVPVEAWTTELQALRTSSSGAWGRDTRYNGIASPFCSPNW
jgi:hypothetical protein